VRYADDPRTRVIARLRPRRRSPTTSSADYQSQLYTDRAGGIWLPTYAGAVRIDPRAVSHDTLPPQVHLERLSVDGTEYPVDAALRLSAHPIRVELTFAATNALVPSRVRAEYRMIGVDTTWRDAGVRRTLSFGPLRGGEYRFEARVAGEDGDWNPVVASLALEVPLWPWEYPGSTVVLALAVAGTALALRLRLRSVERREQVLAALVVERTKELEAERASLEARVQARTADLAREFEERKLLEQRLVTAQKLESIGRLAGGVAHEINNSITGVLGFTELAQHGAKGNAELQSDLDGCGRPVDGSPTSPTAARLRPTPAHAAHCRATRRASGRVVPLPAAVGWGARAGVDRRPGQHSGGERRPVAGGAAHL
jgi:signal transduction histidine kinase